MKLKDFEKWINDLKKDLTDDEVKKLMETEVISSTNVNIEELTAVCGRFLPAGIQPVINVAVKQRRRV